MPTPSRLAQVHARLSLPLVRRATGLLEGRHRSVYKGHGQDFEDLAQYHPGDDVGDMDWKASARAGVPVIRRFVREANLTVLLAVDTGRNMAAAAPDGRPKSEVACFAATVVAYLARQRGDHVALVAADAERTVQLPSRSGTVHLETLLRMVESSFSLQAPPSDLDRVFARIEGLGLRRSLIVLITDEARPGPEHEAGLRRLRARHEVMVIAVADASPLGADDDTVDDVDSALVLPRYLREQQGLLAFARQGLATRRAEAAALLRRHRIEGILAANEDDVVDHLVGLLRRQKRAGR